MLRLCTWLAGILLLAASFAQTPVSPLLPVNSHDPSLPQWAQLMYGEDPNVNEVRDAYNQYYLTHPFRKTIHTQYFKLWMNSVRSKVMPDGHIRRETAAQRRERAQAIMHGRSTDRGAGWTFCGPDVQRASDGSMEEVSEQANIYCNDRASDDPNLLYCGTECGGAYKTTDGGEHWTYVTADYLIGAVTAIRISPANHDVVLLSAENDLWRTTDGGVTWQVIGDPAFQALDISAWEIAFDPSDPSTVLAACNEGMFRSTDTGDNWTEVLPERCETIAFKPGDPAVVYTIEYEPTLNYSRFYKSTDHGLTWTMNDNGWFAPPAGEEGLYEILGGRIAVTAADPQRIYAMLVGYQQNGASITTNGWIGVYRSDDGGASWTLPHGLIGTPYTTAHPNLMNFTGDDGTYTQIHYNTTMVASQLDADRVLIGGLNLWRSNDGCASYQPVGGYIGSLPYFHVDIQEMRIYQETPDSETVWLSSDGGIQRSGDLFASFQPLNRGIMASNLWGYDQGWNDDIRVGGRYHNGNMGYYENYPGHEYLSLGGGEAPTGYVKYTDERKVFFSDIDGKVMPESMDEPAESFGMDLDPNESYYDCNSSRILFDNGYFDVAWSGKDNALMRSTDGGSSFVPFHVFGNTPGNHVLWIDQPFLHPEVLFVLQAVGNTSRIWRTTDNGNTWAQMSLPSTSRNLYFCAGEGPDELWVAYQYRPDGQKVYHTTDGGANWTNLTSPALNGTQITAIAHQLGTDGGVYLGVRTGNVFYRDNTLPDWENWSEGLPVSADPLRIVPFYKGGKVRFAAWNLAVWERGLHSASAVIANFAAASPTFYCAGDSVRFVDHSVCSASATYAWSFPGALPATSTDKYPTVVYSAPGTYDVTLTVTDGGQTSSITKPAYVGTVPTGLFPFAEGFESGTFPEDWRSVHPSEGGGSWGVTDQAGGYGTSGHCMWFNNYGIDVAGVRDEEWLGKRDLGQAQGSYLTFDVAYARYGGQYTDTLAVLVSTDCGASWDEVYLKGGATLATSPDVQDAFVPLASQWRTDNIPLGAYDGQPEVIVSFQNRGHFGNNLYVDNINLSAGQVSGIAETVGPGPVTVFPDPATDVMQVEVRGVRPGTVRLRVVDINGREVLRRDVQANGTVLRTSISVLGLAAGRYQLVAGTVDGRSNVPFLVAPR